MDLISIKLPPDLSSAVAAYAQANGLDRSAALRALIRATSACVTLAAVRLIFEPQ